MAKVAELQDTGNLFTSLNVVRQAVDGPVTNDHIIRYSRLFFDLDPERPADTSSTNAELATSEERCRHLVTFLRGCGWPIPAKGMSGNGTHVQFRTAMPNTPEVKEQLSVIYSGLKRLFSDDVVKLDTSVKNAGRICTAYGSTKRKGIATTERPHRQSVIVIPASWEQVRHRQVDALANSFAKEIAKERVFRRAETAGSISGGTGDYTSLDIVRWFQAHGLYNRPLSGHIHGVTCPWSSEHTTASPEDGSDCVIFEADGGWPGFSCHHSHCSGKGIREVIANLGDASSYCSRSFKWRVS
jgi:hypothetical protein